MSGTQDQPKECRVTSDCSTAGRIWRCLLALLITCGVIVGAVLGMRHLENRVLAGKAGPTPSNVGLQLRPKPDWMPESLGKDIAKSLLPEHAKYNDPNLTDRVFAMAKVHPWIAKVHLVTKHVTSDPRLGLVVVEADFRRPFARVKLDGSRYACVDRDGFRLSDEQAPKWMLTVADDASGSARQACFVSRRQAPRGARPIHYIDVEGVASPPPKVGCLWTDSTASDASRTMAGDLSDGLKLIEAVSTRPYYNQIKAVDVRNYNGRISRSEPFLRMTAQVGTGSATDIRFGRLPLEGGDYEVPTELKLRNLGGYADDHDGCLAGKNRYLDLRYDNLHVSLN